MSARLPRFSARRGLLRMALVLLVPALGTACGEASAPARPAVRNVLLILVDTLRADRLGCYGRQRGLTPNIDALAARGVLYEDCYAQGSNTRYSMLSMMSGLYVTDEEERLPLDHAALAERIQASGRPTAGFVGNTLLAAGSRGFQRGFDHFERPSQDDEARAIGTAEDIFGRFMNWYSGNETALRAGPGFFAWVHVMDPHLPYTVQAKGRLENAGPLPEEERLRRMWADPAAQEWLSPEAQRAAPKDVNAMLRANDTYEAEVALVDEQVGVLLGFLEEHGELDDTLVILAADHGEFLHDRMKYPEELHLWMRKAKPERKTLREVYFSDHGWSFHEELWKTPLIMAGPGIPQGVRRTGLAANLDIYPTVLEAFGLPVPESLRGISLVDGGESRHESVFGYTHFIDAMIGADGWKLVDRRRKLQEYYDPQDVGPESRQGAIELYDLNNDPLETRNLAREHPERVAAMSKRIREWKQENNRVRDTGALSEEDLQALIQLGYLQDAERHGAVIEDDAR